MMTWTHLLLSDIGVSCPRMATQSTSPLHDSDNEASPGTLQDVYESLLYYIEYVEYFEADLAETLETLLAGLHKVKKRLRRLLKPHPDRDDDAKLTTLVTTLKQLKRLFPTMEVMPAEWEDMGRDLEQMENALRFLQHQAKDIRTL